MDPDLEAGSGLDQSRPGVSRGTRRWIRSTPRWIWVDRVEPGSTKWIGPRYNFPMLTEQFCQAHVNSNLGIPRGAKSATHPNPEKFNIDKTKLEVFFAQLNLKLQHNIDPFTRHGQNTEQNKLSYAILRLERNAFAQIEPYVSAENIDFEKINHFVEVLKTRFSKVDPVGTAKHKLYRLYQTNKDLKVFLDIFLRLSKKAKIDDSQALDILYEKLSNEFKDRLVIVRKAENLNDLILLLRNMDANRKKISKQSQLCVKPNASNFLATKPLFKSYNSAPTKLFTAVGVAVVFPVPSTATATHPGPMNMSNVIRQRSILQEEKDRCNNLSLCHYYSELGHIAINHRNPALLVTKREAAGAFTGNSMALVPYKPLSIEDKETSLG